MFKGKPKNSQDMLLYSAIWITLISSKKKNDEKLKEEILAFSKMTTNNKGKKELFKWEIITSF